MKPSQVLELTRYRMEQARQTLSEAEILLREKAWRGSINRAYYAMFYSILALTVTRQVSTSRHSGVIAFFDREFVKTGIFAKELSRKLHLAFEKRQTQDYGEFSEVNAGDANASLSDARGFVDAIEEYLQSKIYPDLEIGQ